MSLPRESNPQVNAIFFDMNGTLRTRIPDQAWQDQSFKLLLKLLEQPDASPTLPEELTRRYKAYTRWANENGISLSEAEIWSEWVAPDLPAELTGPCAPELLLALRNYKGRTVLLPEAAAIIAELHRRGYRLGVISNTTSSIDLPRFIKENDLENYFEAVILSATFGYRKPSPEIFLEAANRLGLPPAECVYIGNNYVNDILGPRNAGYAMAMLVGSGTWQKDDLDVMLSSLNNLLDLFPQRRA